MRGKKRSFLDASNLFVDRVDFGWMLLLGFFARGHCKHSPRFRFFADRRLFRLMRFCCCKKFWFFFALLRSRSIYKVVRGNWLLWWRKNQLHSASECGKWTPLFFTCEFLWMTNYEFAELKNALLVFETCVIFVYNVNYRISVVDRSVECFSKTIFCWYSPIDHSRHLFIWTFYTWNNQSQLF